MFWAPLMGIKRGFVNAVTNNWVQLAMGVIATAMLGYLLMNSAVTREILFGALIFAYVCAGILTGISLAIEPNPEHYYKMPMEEQLNFANYNYELVPNREMRIVQYVAWATFPTSLPVFLIVRGLGILIHRLSMVADFSRQCGYGICRARPEIHTYK